jgi:hypothetical protein
MDDEAYLALDAVRQGKFAGLAGRDHWLKAFKTIKWVVETESGPVLTPAGLQAHDDVANRRRKT